MTPEEIKTKLENLIEIQSTDGNWNYSQYMRGLLNGMLISLSVVTKEDPIFKEDIPYYHADLDIIDMFNNGATIDKIT